MMASNTSENQNHKLVSIIIPVYNREKTLPRLFESLIKIDYRPIEILLVDNYSDDNSLQLCKEFKEKLAFSDIRVCVEQEFKRGACACRNHGIQMSQGYFLYFFDSDDEISPDFIKDLLPCCEDNDLICAPTQLVFENGTRKTRDCIPTSYPHDHILSASLSTQSFIVRKSFIEKIGGWDESLLRWNDWELGIRMLCHLPHMKWLTHKAYHSIYQHPQSISGRSYTEDYKKLLKSLNKARLDITTSSLGHILKAKSFNALAFKYLLLSAHLYQEGQKQHAQEVYNLGKALMQTSKQKTIAPIVYFLGKHHLPGTWRIYRWLV